MMVPLFKCCLKLTIIFQFINNQGNEEYLNNSRNKYYLNVVSEIISILKINNWHKQERNTMLPPGSDGKESPYDVSFM